MAIGAINTVVSKVATPFRKVANWSYVQGKMKFAKENPAEAAAKMLLLSIVSKDLVGCGFYTYQSWNNEKIPESKRKFVAMTDLMNGIVMVGGQLFAGKIVDERITPWIKSRFTGDAKGTHKLGTDKALHSDNLKAMAHNLIKENKLLDPLKLSPAEAKKSGEKLVKNAVTHVEKNFKSPFLAGLGIIVTTIGTTALTKRVLAPLFSTPMAGYINNNFLNNKGNIKKDNRTSYEVAALATTKYKNPILDNPISNRIINKEV